MDAKQRALLAMTAERNAWINLCADLNEVVAEFLDAMPPEIENRHLLRAKETVNQVRIALAARKEQVANERH